MKNSRDRQCGHVPSLYGGIRNRLSFQFAADCATVISSRTRRYTYLLVMYGYATAGWSRFTMLINIYNLKHVRMPKFTCYVKCLACR